METFYENSGYTKRAEEIGFYKSLDKIKNLPLIGYDWETNGVYLDNSWTESAKLYPEDSERYQWQEGVTKIGEALVKGVESRINAEHALHVLEIIDAARKSSETGMKLKLKSKFPWPMV